MMEAACSTQLQFAKARIICKGLALNISKADYRAVFLVALVDSSSSQQ
jgi:hypothetical protein